MSCTFPSSAEWERESQQGPYHSELISVQVPVFVDVAEVPDLQGKSRRLTGWGAEAFPGWGNVRLYGEEKAREQQAHQPDSASECSAHTRIERQSKCVSEPACGPLKNDRLMKYCRCQGSFYNITFISSNK